MPASFRAVSEDIFNRDQSWYYVCVLRNNSGPVRIEVRANAYESQSVAKIEDRSADGWSFHTSIPTHEWYDQAPNYTKRHPDDRDMALFRELRERLLERYAAAMWGTLDGVEVDDEETLL